MGWLASMTDIATAKKKSAQFIAAIDPAELACRILEASARIKRPLGKTAVQCLADLPEQDCADLMRGATAAMDYWRECISAMQRTS